MILSCPKCATQFLIDPSALGERGRTVRCGRCSHAWLQKAVKSEHETYEPPPLDTDGLDGLEVRSLPPAHGQSTELALAANRRRLVLWFFIVFVLAVVIFGAYRFRNAVVSVWPASARAYAALGVSVAAPAGTGLIVPPETVLSRRVSVGDEPVLVIEGTIKNAGLRPREVGSIRITLRGKDDAYMRRWDYVPERRTLAAGATMRFETRVTNPPATAFETQFEFLPEK